MGFPATSHENTRLFLILNKRLIIWLNYSGLLINVRSWEKHDTFLQVLRWKLWSNKSEFFILQVVRWWIDWGGLGLLWMCWAQQHSSRHEDSIYGTLTSDVLLSRRSAQRNSRLQMCSLELTTQTRIGKSVVYLKFNKSMRMSTYCV